MQTIPIFSLVVILFAVFILANSIRVLREYERGVIFRLGRLVRGGEKGPGLIFLIPIVDRMVKVSLRTVVMDVPPAGCHYAGQCVDQSECRNLFSCARAA